MEQLPEQHVAGLSAQYDRRSTHHDAAGSTPLPEPTHTLMSLPERPPIPLWVVALCGFLLSVGGAWVTVNGQIAGKADKSEVRALNAKMERMLDLLCEGRETKRQCQPDPEP